MTEKKLTLEEGEIELSPAVVEEEEERVSKLELEEEEEQTCPKKSELVELYLLTFEIPNFGLARVKVEREVVNQSFLREVSVIERELARMIENLRRRFYDDCNKIFETSKLGWIAVTEDAVKFAEQWNKTFRYELQKFADKYVLEKLKSTNDPSLREIYEKIYYKLKRRAENLKIVEAVKIFVEPHVAREILEEICNRLNEEIEVLKKKIEEAEKEQNKSRIYKLNRELTIRQLKLKTFQEKLREV